MHVRGGKTAWGSAAAGMALAAALGSLTGCGVPLQSRISQQAQVAFVGLVHEQAPDIASYRSDLQLVQIGRTVCDDLGSGASVEDVANRIPLVEGSVSMPPADLGAIISASVTFICPRYHSQLGGSSGIPAS